MGDSMKYNDESLPSAEIMSKMNNEFNKPNVEMMSTQVEICEMGEYRQQAEIEEIYQLLQYCESFFKWLEGKDNNFDEIKNLLEKTISDKTTTLGCCGRHGLDYRYACDKDFNDNCKDYCKCEMEIIEKVIKLLALKNSIVDKQCMIKLVQSRMEALKLIFGKYCK